MSNQRLVREWTLEEAAEETKDSDESLSEASITHRRTVASNPAIGGSDHAVGEESHEADDSALLERTVAPDPPRSHQPTEGA
jgi:hypothetical protein